MILMLIGTDQNLIVIFIIACSYNSQGHPESGKILMNFIDYIIINQIGFETTMHDCCICKYFLMEVLSIY